MGLLDLATSSDVHSIRGKSRVGKYDLMKTTTGVPVYYDGGSTAGTYGGGGAASGVSAFDVVASDVKSGTYIEYATRDPYAYLLGTPCVQPPDIHSVFWNGLARLVYSIYGAYFWWAWAHTVWPMLVIQHDTRLREMFGDRAVINTTLIGEDAYLAWLRDFNGNLAREIRWQPFGNFAKRYQRDWRRQMYRASDLETYELFMCKLVRSEPRYTPRAGLGVIAGQVVSTGLSDYDVTENADPDDSVMISRHLPDKMTRLLDPLHDRKRLCALIQQGVRCMYSVDADVNENLVLVITVSNYDMYMTFMALMIEEIATQIRFLIDLQRDSVKNKSGKASNAATMKHKTTATAAEDALARQVAQELRTVLTAPSLVVQRSCNGEDHFRIMSLVYYGNYKINPTSVIINISHMINGLLNRTTRVLEYDTPDMPSRLVRMLRLTHSGFLTGYGRGEFMWYAPITQEEYDRKKPVVVQLRSGKILGFQKVKKTILDHRFHTVTTLNGKVQHFIKVLSLPCAQLKGATGEILIG